MYILHQAGYIVQASSNKMYHTTMHSIGIRCYSAPNKQSHAQLCRSYMWNKTLKLFQNFSVFYFTCNHIWHYFKIISAAKIISVTLNMLENIEELQ